MTKTSKVLSVILALAMLFSVSVPAVFAEEAKKLEDYPEEVLLLDVSSEKAIKQVSDKLKANKKNTNESTYSAEWKLSDLKSLSLSKTKDISAYETIEFYMYGDKDHPTTLLFTIWADDKNSDGSDYYNGGEFEVKEGWNKYSFSISEIKNKKSRSPKPLSDIDYIGIWATGWGLDEKNDLDNTTLYLDKIVMKRGDKLLDAPVIKQPETEAGTAKYFEYDFEVADKKDLSGINMAAKSNTIDLVKDKKNTYLKIENTGGTEDCFIDISVKNTRRYMVIQADVMSTDFGGGGQIFAVKDSTNAQNHFLLLKGDGKVTANNNEIMTLKEGTWVKLAVAADLDNHTYNVYADGKLVKKDIPMNNQDLGYITLFRTFVSTKLGSNICIDNLCMFDGKSPDDYSKAVDKPTATTAPSKNIDVNSTDIPAFKQVKSDAVSDVKDAVCLKLGSPYALVRQKQTPIDADNKDVTPFVVNNRTLVPVRFIAESFGADVDWNQDTKTVTIKKDQDTITLVLGSNILNKNGTDITIDVPAEAYNYRTMLPLRAVTENLGKQVFWDDMGLIIISDNEINYTKENDLDKMLNIMAGFTYERPSRETIKEDILKNSPNHPRVMATAQDFERIRSLNQTDENMQMWVERIIKAADKYATAFENGTAVDPVYKIDEGGRYSNDTETMAYTLGMAYQITSEKKYVDTMWNRLRVMCDRTKFDNWHVGHFLNAASHMAGVAIAYDWMFDAWTPEQKTTIEEALYDCGIEDSITAYYGATDYLSPPMGVWHRSGWWSQGNNWNAVCNSGVVLASAAMATHEKYGDLAIKAMNFAIKAMEIGLRCYAPDGGYEEGPGYWAYGTNNLVNLLATLETAAGTTYGLADAPGLDKTWATPLYSESKQGMFNYSDTNVSRTDTSSLFWFGKHYNNPQVSGLRFNELETADKTSTVRDIIWYRPENVDKSASIALDYKFFKTDTLTMRSSWSDSNQLFVGLHGGSNTANHCNIDSGTFVLDALNTRWFLDLGADYYNLPNYWSTGTGGKRWQYYAQRAEGHNTFVINPGLAEDQVIKSVSPVVDFVSKPRGAYGKVDLTPAYATDAKKATRGIMLAGNRKAVVVQDEIEMLKPSEFYWFAHTKADINVAADGKSAVLTLGAKKLYAKIVSDNADFKFDVMDAVSLPTSPKYTVKGEYSRAGIRKLVIHGSDIEKVNLAVMFVPMDSDSVPEYNYTYTALDSWSISDGEILTPKLEDLKVNGETVKGFNRDVTGYDVVLPYGTTEVPQISATADSESDYNVTLPQALPGNAVIKVTNKQDPSMFTIYNVALRAAKDIEIEASDAQEGNPPENCLDDNLDTRWAVEGESWGIFRFANPKTISSVWIATWKAAERNLIFDIEVSEDGENFKQVFSGKTAATKDELEEIKIPAGTYKAVKLVMHGTTTGTWNSVLEVNFK